MFLMLPAASASISSRTAHIAITSRSPVVVSGTGFQPNERVTVNVSAKSTRRKVVTATRLGAFRATFRGFSVGYCQPYSAQAKGDRGSRASMKVIPECPSQ